MLQRQVLVIQSRCSSSGPANGQDRRCESRVSTQKYRQDRKYRRRRKCPKSQLKWLMFCQDHIKVGNIKLHPDSSCLYRCLRWRLVPASGRQERSCQFAPSCTQFGALCLYSGTSRLKRCQVRRLFLRRVFPSWSRKVQSRRRDSGCPSGVSTPCANHTDSDDTAGVNVRGLFPKEKWHLPAIDAELIVLTQEQRFLQVPTFNTLPSVDTPGHRRDRECASRVATPSVHHSRSSSDSGSSPSARAPGGDTTAYSPNDDRETPSRCSSRAVSGELRRRTTGCLEWC